MVIGLASYQIDEKAGYTWAGVIVAVQRKGPAGAPESGLIDRCAVESCHAPKNIRDAGPRSETSNGTVIACCVWHSYRKIPKALP